MCVCVHVCVCVCACVCVWKEWGVWVYRAWWALTCRSGAYGCMLLGRSHAGCSCLVLLPQWTILVKNIFPKHSRGRTLLLWRVLDDNDNGQVTAKEFASAADVLNVNLMMVSVHNKPTVAVPFVAAYLACYVSYVQTHTRIPTHCARTSAASTF